MKAFKIILVVVIVCSIIRINSNAQANKGERLLDKIILSQQIPETELSSIPTIKLIQALLNSYCPFFLSIYEDINSAYKRVYFDYNGVRELLKRDDAGQKLIELYQRLDPAEYEKEWDPVKSADFFPFFCFL